MSHILLYWYSNAATAIFRTSILASFNRDATTFYVAISPLASLSLCLHNQACFKVG